MGWRKMLGFFIKGWVFFFFIIGLYTGLQWLQYETTRMSSEKIEENWEFDEITGYNTKGGEPLFLVNPNYDRTVFFLEGFRTQNPSGMYMEWFKELHENQGVNIVVPVYGLQSSPFTIRNREWDFREDLRTVTQIYDAYTAGLHSNHKMITISQSFGTLPHLEILRASEKEPVYSVFLSPLNSKMEYKAGGELVYRLSKQNWWLHKVISFTKPSPPSNRASVWDIVDEEANKEYARRFPVNPEDQAKQGYQVEQAAHWMEENLMGEIHSKEIDVVWGDQDLYFSQKGFLNFAEKLSHGNNVHSIALEETGHMVLLDNGSKELKERIVRIIDDTRD